ncbi:hypothetical protein AB0O20_03065 [Streptomyces kronopolitis]|uniref:hypothetical protein n=1 Tax=Streptomyces kronopolitis TaxID=1612435 RepID=UPI003413DB63
MTVPSSSAQPSHPGLPYPPGSVPPQQGSGGTPSGGWQMPPGAGGVPGAGFAAPAAVQGVCRVCGGAPAVKTRFRRHQGLLFVMRFNRIDGPFCRDCGTAVYREQTAGTLWQGWWSPLSLVLFTPGTLIANRVALGRVNKLSDPTGWIPGYGARPGKEVLRRASSLVALVPLAWAIWVLANIINEVSS